MKKAITVSIAATLLFTSAASATTLSDLNKFTPDFASGIIWGVTHALIGTGVASCPSPISSDMVKAALRARYNLYANDDIGPAIAGVLRTTFNCRIRLPQPDPEA